MLEIILVSIISYLLGMISVIIFSIIKVSSKCSKKEDRTKDWFKFGQDVYDEIEKIKTGEK